MLFILEALLILAKHTSRERKALTNQPRKCRSDTIMARIVAEKSESSFSQVIHSAGVRRFGEAQRTFLASYADLRALIPVAGRGDGSAELLQHAAACGLKTRPFVFIMKAGYCDQFALIEADQRCIDHVFRWHDD